jgi:hypothetical protein
MQIWFMLVNTPQVEKDFSAFYAKVNRPESIALWKCKESFFICADSRYEKDIISFFSAYGALIPSSFPHASFFAEAKFCGGSTNALAKDSPNIS